jgi:hypothetical protein
MCIVSVLVSVLYNHCFTQPPPLKFVASISLTFRILVCYEMLYTMHTQLRVWDLLCPPGNWFHLWTAIIHSSYLVYIRCTCPCGNFCVGLVRRHVCSLSRAMLRKQGWISAHTGIICLFDWFSLFTCVHVNKGSVRYTVDQRFVPCRCFNSPLLVQVCSVPIPAGPSYHAVTAASYQRCSHSS